MSLVNSPLRPSPKSAPSIPPSHPSWKRADRALRCAPFQLSLFIAMRSQSIPLAAMSAPAGVTIGYTRKPLTELGAENSLLWLIQVGLLRREVDGQGITDRFRLTPLGRDIVATWEEKLGDLPPASFGDRLRNFIDRLIPGFLR